MISEEIKNIKSGKKDLRKFGITMAIALGVLGLLFLWRGRGFFYYFFILSTAFLILGVVAPMFLKPIQKAWMTFAILMGWFMTRFILSILFFVVFTLIALVARLFNKRFLDLQIDKSCTSYWKHREPEEVPKEDYERQF